jgi:Fe-S cluster assembly protein SufD
MEKTFEQAWGSGLRERAREMVARGRAPIRTDEAWRFAPVGEFGDREYVPISSSGSGSVEVSPLFDRGAVAARMVTWNGRLVSLEGGDSSWGSLTGLSGAAPSEWVRRVLEDVSAPLGSDRFAAIHRAEVEEGAVIEVNGALAEGHVIEVVHVVEGNSVRLAPFCGIRVHAGAQATIVERFIGVGEANVTVVGSTYLDVEEGGLLRYASIQEFGPKTVSLQMNRIRVGSGGRAHALGLHLGGRVSRVETAASILGEGASCEMLSACHATGSRWFDQRTLQDHVSPDATSDLLYKNALDDGARSVFSGLIRVGREAHRTDAYQKVRNLVLSDEAEANSMPGLEILADEVRCSHGATTGQLDPEELFYLKARGIPDSSARRLITGGFLNEAVQRFPDALVRGVFADRVAMSLMGSVSTSVV